MPEFDCRGLDEKIILLNLTGIMCYPAEKHFDKRRYWMLRQILNIAAESYLELLPEYFGRERELNRTIGSWLADANVCHGGWVAFRNALVGPGQKMSPVEQINERAGMGKVVGLVLVLALDNGWSLKEARDYLCSEPLIETARKLDHEPSILNPESIHQHIWPQFKPAAHLWAAFVRGMLASGRCDPPNTRWWTEKERRYLLPLEDYPAGGVAAFLEIAARDRSAALSKMPQRGPRKPMLDPEKAWSIIASEKL